MLYSHQPTHNSTMIQKDTENNAMPNSEFFVLDAGILRRAVERVVRSWPSLAKHWFIKRNRLRSLVWVQSCPRFVEGRS